MGSKTAISKKGVFIDFPKASKRNYVEALATVSFIIFLVGVFAYSYFAPKNLIELGRLSSGSLFITDEFTVHAYPLLAILLYSFIPNSVFIFLSPFAIVSVYLSLYFLVSKKIIYLFPLTVWIALGHHTLVPGVIDFLFLPLIYNRINAKHDTQAVILSLLAVYIHGFITVFYLVVMCLYMRKIKLITLILLLSLPQLLPLYYFSKDYYSVWNNVSWIFYIPTFGVIDSLQIQLTAFWSRFLTIGIYIGTFLLCIGNKK